MEPEPSGEEGLADVRVLAALQESARQRRPIALPALQRTRRPEPDQKQVQPPVQAPTPVDAPAPTTD